MSKTLFALLVALVSITGWQVLQKYKGEGFNELSAIRSTWNGWVGKSTTPVANAPAPHPGYVQYDQYGRIVTPPVYGQGQAPTPIPYDQHTQYGQPAQPAYPQNYGQQPQPGYGQNPQLAPLNQNPLVHTQPYGYGQNGYGQTSQPTTVGYPQAQYPGQYGAQQYGQPQYGMQPYDPRTQQPAYDFGTNPLQPVQNPYGTQQPVAQSGGTIRVASFNIQVFGESKLRKPDAMRVLVDLVRRFDVVAIQEVRAVSDDILPRFIQEINASGRRYDFVIGPREGRTSSKEQYAYVYDTATIECDRSTVFSAQNPGGAMHRTPLVASFRARNAPPQQAFTFTLIDIHTDPDEVKTEVAALVDAVRAIRQQLPNEDDIFLLGDLNANDKQLVPFQQIPNFTTIVVNTPTNTRGNQQYDNIIYPREHTVEYTGRWGVVDFALEYGLSEAQALEVSDHRPIWAEFGVYENQPGSSGQFVQQPQAALR